MALIKRKGMLKDYMRKHWLLMGIIGCILFASLFPWLGSKEGPLRPNITVKCAVTVIFLISGLSFKSDNIYTTFKQYRLHSFIQLFTFVFIPIFVQILTRFLSMFNVNSWILKGLITVGCMPPPVSSAVILTRSAQGNEIGAIFNSVVGSFLGIIVTPVLLLFNLGYTTVIPLATTFVQLTCTVLVPIVIGQSIRHFTSFRGYNLPMNAVGQCSLLFIVYTTFCDTFLTPDTGLSASDILITVFLVLLVQMLLLTISYYTAMLSKNYYTTPDVIAIVFCSTHKSLTLGIPILRIMFHGYSHLSQISLPLLVYHPTQIILGGLLVSYMKDWIYTDKNKRPPV